MTPVRSLVQAVQRKPGIVVAILAAAIVLVGAALWASSLGQGGVLKLVNVPSSTAPLLPGNPGIPETTPSTSTSTSVPGSSTSIAGVTTTSLLGGGPATTSTTTASSVPPSTTTSSTVPTTTTTTPCTT